MINRYFTLVSIITLASCGSQPVKPNINITTFGVYGNWCGLDYPRNMSTAALPINELDASCMRHDMCYAEKGKYACDCDKIFSEELGENLLADNYPTEQKYYARSFYQYFKGSWCNGTPESKVGASRALQNIYNQTSEKATNIYDYIIGNQEGSADDESAPIITSQSQNGVKKK
ncbi:MAG: hypothetical protein V4660_03880 [Pseudomonadota bacterium]